MPISSAPGAARVAGHKVVVPPPAAHAGAGARAGSQQRASAPPRPGARPADLRAFHRAWLAALRATLDTTPNRELAYPEPGGHPRLRQTLSEYLQRVRGAAVRADNVTVTTGVTDGMIQVFRALGAAGVGAVAVEDPGWYRRPVATVQGMDPARVALFGSLSKTLAPALSLGWGSHRRAGRRPCAPPRAGSPDLRCSTSSLWPR
jgi:DNA-binding transcriptional MocR family regulator